MESLFSPAHRPPSPPTAGPTTDFALIESQKENIRPLASGRSAATLSNVLREPSAAEKVVQEGHERHRKDIEEAERRDKEGEDMMDGVQDVLDVYNKYILFVVQHHPSSDTHLLPLLETTTRRFVNDARYTQDVRYLKLWVMYARQIERREEIWAFLESRDIGTKHSVFYEEWAAALEGLGRRKKADEIYRIGIARKASPVDRLKTRHKQFLERIMAPPSGVVPEDDSVVAAPARTPGRSILGHVATASTSVTGATQLAPSLRTSSKNNGSKMEIFADDGAKGAEDPAPGEWAEFGTRDGRRKENTVEAGPWKGETLPQSTARGRVTPRTPKVEVFKDVSENDAVRAADEVFSRIKQQPPTEAELLKSDPLRHYDTTALSTDIPSLPAPPSARKPPKPSKPLSHFVMKPWECPTDGPEVKGNGGKVERRMFDWNNVFRGKDEWSFEEVRARQRGLMGKDWRGDVKDWEKTWHKPGSSTPKKEEKRQRPPSPTVNTKLAELEVMRMFDQTIHGKVRDADSDSNESSSDEEDEPIQSAPTPLPSRTGPVSMLATPGGFVPPTPTPAQGHVAQNRTFVPATIGEEGAPPPTIFSDENASRSAAFMDENAVPPSASKASKVNIFSDTPAKTPLASRTSLAASSSKPRAFGIFTEDENAPPPPAPFAEVSLSTQARPPPQVSNNVFATPVPARHAPLRRGVTEVIQEVPESDEDGDLVHEVVEDVAHVHLNDLNEEEEEPQPRGMRRFQINAMTPITERTCEYTQLTALRSSMTGTSRQFSVPESDTEAEEGDAFVASTSNPSRLIGSFGSSAAQDQEAEQSVFIPIDFDKSGSPDSNPPSGDVEAGFQLPEGFTIHKPDRDHSGSMHTMHLTEATDMETMHTAREASVEPDTDAFVTASQPQSVLPNPCNPACAEVIATLLASITPPVSALPGLVDHRGTPSRRLEGLQKHARSKVRRASTSSRNSIAGGDDSCSLDMQGKMFEILDKIGEGGFGAVFLAVDVDARRAQDDADSDDEDEDEKDDSLVAVKVEQPCSVWEAVVLDRIHQRIDTALRSSIVRARNIYAYHDESFLVLDYSHQGTVLDIVNKATTMGIAPSVSGGPSAVDELLAIFFTIELLKLVEGLHRAGFIHGDLKIDNCLVRLDDPPNPSSWSATYDRSGNNGWSYKGVKLIDFGRAIDLTLYPAGEKQQFVVDWKTDERDCKEMRENRSWSYQTDYFGLAGVAYCMLFGKYMGTEVVEGRDKIDMPFKRYWQSSLWNSLFDALLNPGDELPITGRLTEIRGEFESWLEENCQKGGKSLKSMLKKIELAAITGRK
ncbi:hypothetical protein IAR55_004165 [Kwoniella newhampshirensis]|uniref:BUB protein kinase n=1 Tax=Kwoniella newhampshirensis TaxID=1651941 RepID=A0AAW0YMS6_9TREE